jgi:hypothetical protein
MNGQEFLDEKQGFHFNGQRAKLLETCSKFGLTPNKVTVISNVDLYWPTRRNRTENEKKAVMVGKSNTTHRGYLKYVLWVFPS